MKVSIEQLEFPSSIKDKILKLKDISKLHIDFIGDKYIHFENNPTLYDKSTMQNITMESIKFLIIKC